MNFNDKLTRNQNNLDNAYDAMLDAGDRKQLEREEFEARMCEDKDFFANYAWKFMGSNKGYSQGLLDWSWEHYQAERTSAYDNGWDERPTNREYWNCNDDRI